jgi:hypothetical protein
MIEQIAADVAAIKEMLANGAGAPAAAAAEKPKRAPKAKEEKPSFTADQLRDKFLEVQQKHGDAAAKALIREQGHEKLANLIADAANWQKYWDAAEEKLAEEPEGDDNGGL